MPICQLLDPWFGTQGCKRSVRMLRDTTKGTVAGRQSDRAQDNEQKLIKSSSQV